MPETFKICYLNKNVIEKTIIFGGGSSLATRPVSDLDIYKVEGEEEISSMTIYKDDTIETIKRKIIKNDTKLSVEEIYLFCSRKVKFDSVVIYNNLTQNNKLHLIKVRFQQLLFNINRQDLIDQMEDKDIYTYDDILSLNLDGSEVVMNQSLGHKFVVSNQPVSFTINPYDVIDFEPFLEKYTDELTTTTNKYLLMTIDDLTNDTKIYNDSIYVCIASKVLDSMKDKDISIVSSIKIYYPNLIQDGISSIKLLNENKEELLINSQKLISQDFQRNIDNIDLFYNIYEKRTEDLNYITNGINKIEFILRPNIPYNLPLDIIFKLLHATKLVPFIKYNQSKRMEKIYRLYVNKISTKGKKIPYLNKSTIFRLMKSIGKSKTVSCYIEYEYEGNIIPIICEFSNDASISITIELQVSYETSIIAIIVNEAVNPVIDIVRKNMEQSGYSIPVFNTLYDSNVDIIDIQYECILEIDKIINLSKIIGCVSSVFNVVEGNLKKGISLRYKRVSNYNEMDSQEAFILDFLNKDKPEEEIVEAMVHNFGMNDKSARIKLSEILTSVGVVQNLYKKNKIKIKNSPGFLTTITQEKFKNNIMITVSGINNIQYLSTIPIYLDSLIRITQNPKSTGVSIDEINKLCHQTKLIEEQIEEIIAPSELPYPENEQSDIIAQELVFEHDKIQDSMGDDLLDFLMDDDDDDDDDEVDDADDVNVSGGSDSDSDSDSAEIEFGSEVGSLHESDEESDEELEPPQIIKIKKSKSKQQKKSKDSKDSKDSNSDEKLDTNIAGISLGHPNPIFTRLKKRDPSLFLTKKDGKYSAYSRSCPWNLRRQPVILTDKEKADIDKKHPGSYDEALKYGTNPNKQHWYICPRYWSLKYKTSLTEAEVKSGKYGNVIPLSAKTVPSNANIFEFNDGGTEHIGKDGKYVKHNPGFLETDRHPKDYCVPCCFKSWDSKKQKRRREECAASDSKEKIKIKVPVKKIDAEDYIKGVDKFPIDQNRWGFLPISIQKFLKIDNRKCQISITNTKLKPHQMCLLRRGVQLNREQSFVACIADVYSEYLKTKQVPTITEMKQIIIASMDLDNFFTYQNGTLLTLFSKNINIETETKSESAANKSLSKVESVKSLSKAEAAKSSPKVEAAKSSSEAELQFGSEVGSSDSDEDSAVEQIGGVGETLSAYQNSLIYKSTDFTNKDQIIFLTNAITSYENFIQFLESDNILIDYTYLWDIVCARNPKLFPQGLNLVILEMSNDDLTDNVKLICPTNHYSNEFFDINKNTLILIKNDSYYEPIYALEDKVTVFEVTRVFNLKSKNIIPNLKSTLEIIKRSLDTNCVPLPSMPKVYEFKENLITGKLIGLLKDTGYDITNQVLNYNGKVIGLIIKKGENEGFIPSLPSSLIVDAGYGIKWIDDDIWDSYSNTRDLLIKVNNETNKKVLCLPLIKVIEDGLIIGIITETNQFLAISPPEQDTFGDDLRILNESNYLIADKTSILSNKKDIARVKYIKNIKLETEFYNTFRNTIRILLGKMEYRQSRKEIEDIINKPDMLYTEKFKIINDKLRELLQGYIQFINYEDSVLEKIDNITTCLIDTPEECKNKKYCSINDKGLCKLLVPKINFINKQDNDNLYYGKVSDELIRYSQIRNFIFEPQSFLSFSNVKYNLNDTEIILLQSLLTPEYFDNIVIQPDNIYTEKNTYDTVNPQISKYYSQWGIQHKETEKTKPIEKFKKKIKVLNVVVEPAEPIEPIKPVEPIKEKQKKKLKLLNIVPEQSDKKYICETIKKSMTKWKPFFPTNTSELEYVDDTPLCSFEILMTIIKDFIPDSKIKTIHQLKELLIHEYSKLEDKIYILSKILESQGKNSIVSKVLLGMITFDAMIMSENYYITNLDIELIVLSLNIPLIFISSRKLIDNNRPLLVVNNTKSGKFYFIKVPIIQTNTVIKYRLFITTTAKQFEISKLAFSLQNDIRVSPEFNLNEYITKFKITEKKAPKLKLVENLAEKREEVIISPTDEEELLKQLENEEQEDEFVVPAIKAPNSI